MLNKIRERQAETGRFDSGFTLIELLIVIVILGVLAAIVVFSVAGVTDKGKKSACKSDVTTVNTASEAYYAQKGAYAADMDALVTAGLLHAVPTATDADNGYHVVYAATKAGADGTVCPPA
jgi:general secretion pathway protein G